MANLTEELEEFSNKVFAKICFLLVSKGVKSEHSSNIVLKIEDEEVMFNLEGGRYLTEITGGELIDNGGYKYSLYAIPIGQLCEVIDSISEQPSKFRVGIEVDEEMWYKYFDDKAVAYEYFVKKGIELNETQTIVLEERLETKNRHGEPNFEELNSLPY